MKDTQLYEQLLSLQYTRDENKAASRPGLRSINRCVEGGSRFKVSLQLHDADTLPLIRSIVAPAANSQ